MAPGPNGEAYGSALGQFYQPKGIAVGADGTVYVADTYNNRIQVRSVDGTWTQWGSYGEDLGQFSDPSGVAVGADGTVYVADTFNDRIQARSVDGTWTQWGSYGEDLGQFNRPMGVAVGADGTVYVADTYNNRIQARSVDGTWTQWGSKGYVYDYSSHMFYRDVYDQKEFLLGQFWYPQSVAVGKDGTVYVADTFNHRVQARSVDGTWTWI